MTAHDEVNPRCKHGVAWIDACEPCEEHYRAEKLHAALREISDMGCGKVLPHGTTCQTMKSRWRDWKRSQWCASCIANEALEKADV